MNWTRWSALGWIITGRTSLFLKRSKKGDALAGGCSIEESAACLFDGMAEDKLYIGPKAFEPQLEDIREVIAKRSRNIADEVNL